MVGFNEVSLKSSHSEFMARFKFALADDKINIPNFHTTLLPILSMGRMRETK